MRRAAYNCVAPLPRSALQRGIVECFFFDSVIVGAGFAAKAPYVIERLVAIPASPFGLQCGDRCRLDYSGCPARFSTLISMVCIVHDSAAQKSHRCAHSRNIDTSIVPTADVLKSMPNSTGVVRLQLTKNLSALPTLPITRPMGMLTQEAQPALSIVRPLFEQVPALFIAG